MATSQTSTPSQVGYIELLQRNRDFRWLWAGQIVSLLGDWFNLIASAALLSQLTESGLAIGSLFVIRMLAPFLVAPFAGVIADRYNRKWILIGTDIIRGITVIGFLFISRPEHVWLLYLLTAIQLGTGGFFFPTKNAILPDIVEPEELGTANTISSVTWSTMLAIGAALGGLVAGLWGNTPAFILDSVTFFVSAWCIWQVRYTLSEEVQQSDKSVGAAIAQYVEGLSYLKNRIDQFFITLVKGVNALVMSSGFQIIQVALSESIFVIGQGGGISLGLMFGTAGIGTGLGPIMARWITGDEERPMRWGIVAGWLIGAVGVFLASTLLSFPLVLFGIFLRGFGGGIIWVFSTQLLLQMVPGEVRGRIFGTEYMFFTLLSAAGAAATGLFLDSIGVVNAMRLMGFVIVIPAVLWGLWTWHVSRKGELV